MPCTPISRADPDEVLPLGELRRQLGVSQTSLSAGLGTSQPYVAQIERQTDMHISTLRRYIEGLGGELHLVVSLPGQTLEIDLGRAPARLLHNLSERENPPCPRPANA